MKRLLIALVLLTMVAYAGYKVTVWVLVDRNLNAASEALSEQAVLSREGISSRVSGQVSLHQATYQAFRLNQPLQIASLTFIAGSPITLMHTLISPESLPLEWQLKADGLVFELGGGLLRTWVAPEQAGVPALFSLVCGPGDNRELGSADLARMGVPAVTGDARLVQNAEGVHFELNTREMGSLELNQPGARLQIAGLAEIFAGRNKRVEVILRDGGLMRKVAAYCAREAGVETAVWARTATDRFHDALNARGYEPSTQLLALYQRWLTEGGQMEFTLRPGEAGLGIPVLGSVPDTAPDKPALPVLTYNDALVPDVYLTPVAPEPSSLAEEPPEPVAAPGPSVPSWWPEKLENAERWPDRKVRVTLSSGRVLEGRLAGILDRRLEVARMVDGGEVAYPVALTAIERFEVWRRAADTGRPVPDPPVSLPEQEPEPGPEAAPETEAGFEPGTVLRPEQSDQAP